MIEKGEHATKRAWNRRHRTRSHFCGVEKDYDEVAPTDFGSGGLERVEYAWGNEFVRGSKGALYDPNGDHSEVGVQPRCNQGPLAGLLVSSSRFGRFQRLAQGLFVVLIKRRLKHSPLAGELLQP